MFERVITQTIQRISSEVLRDRQSVPLTEILEDERIPSRFKPFFATEVRWWLYNDALARATNKRFDFANPELASLVDYLEQVMFRHARFEHDEFISTLDSAVKLTFNYLCRPQTTLKWYIFRGQPVKPLSEVMLRFESFLDYEYIGNVFAEWVERKVRERATFEAISATEFERIIRRIDDQILLSCTVDELLALLDPIFDFIGDGDEQDVPLDALIIFFDDKNITRLVEHLERYRTPNATVSRSRFIGILEELLTSAEENPEADFSSVYQNDELDDIVRRHLEADGKFSPRPGSEAPPEDDLGEFGGGDEPLVAPSREDRGKPVEIDEPSLVAADANLEKIVATEAPPVAPAERKPEDPAPTGASETADSTGPTVAELANTAGGRDEVTELAAASVSSTQTPVPSINDAASIDDVVSKLDQAEGPIDEPAAARLEQADDRTVAAGPSGLEQSMGPNAEAAPPGEANQATAAVPAAESAPYENAPPEPALDPMLERKVLKKVFNRDRAAYDDAMNRLATADSWREASQVLDELFIRYDIDPYSRTALRFTDSIYTRFVPRTHNQTE